MRTICASLVAIALCTLASGCTDDAIGRTSAVKGTVSVGDQPLKGGSVTYWPDEAKGNKSKLEAAGTVTDSGSYELSTRGKPGAVVGWYKVTVAPAVPADNKNPVATGKAPFDATYTTKEKTPLSVEVSDSAASGQYNLKLK